VGPFLRSVLVSALASFLAMLLVAWVRPRLPAQLRVL